MEVRWEGIKLSNDNDVSQIGPMEPSQTGRPCNESRVKIPFKFGQFSLLAGTGRRLFDFMASGPAFCFPI